MRAIAYLFVAVLMTGCAVKGTPMSTVLKSCGKSMPYYVDCVKETYQKEGIAPNDSDVRSFYAELDLVKEKYLAGRMTQTEAVVEIDRAWRVLNPPRSPRPVVYIID